MVFFKQFLNVIGIFLNIPNWAEIMQASMFINVMFFYIICRLIIILIGMMKYFIHGIRKQRLTNSVPLVETFIVIVTYGAHES